MECLENLLPAGTDACPRILAFNVAFSFLSSRNLWVADCNLESSFSFMNKQLVYCCIHHRCSSCLHPLYIYTYCCSFSVLRPPCCSNSWTCSSGESVQQYVQCNATLSLDPRLYRTAYFTTWEEHVEPGNEAIQPGRAVCSTYKGNTCIIYMHCGPAATPTFLKSSETLCW